MCCCEKNSSIKLIGYVFSGSGVAKDHAHLWQKHLKQLTGTEMFAGTLNVKLSQPLHMLAASAKSFRVQKGVFKLWSCTINGHKAYIVKPPLASWPSTVLEIMSHEKLRSVLHLKDGDRVIVELCISHQARDN